MRPVATVALIAATLFPRSGAACSMTVIGPPQAQLDANEYIFAAEVLAYVGPLTAEDVRGEVWGLRLRVLRAVYAPRSVKEVELFSYDLAPDCVTWGTRRESLERAYPVGSTVLAYAWPARQLISQDDAIHLEVSWIRGGLTRSPLDAFHALHRTVDYASAFKLPRQEFDRQGYGPTTVVMHFELQKEFARLAVASRRERREILKRLMYHPWAPYELIVRTHLGQSRSADRLIAEWKLIQKRR